MLGSVLESQSMGYSEGHTAWLGVWFSSPSTEPGADTAGWILRGWVVNRYGSASWDIGKQQVCVGEGFLHGSGRDSKDQALKDFH